MSTNTIQTEALLQAEVLRLKDKKTIIKQAANTKYEGALANQGDTVSVQTFPDIFGGIGGTAGADIAINSWAIGKEQLEITDVYQSGVDVKNIEEIQSNLNLGNQIANRFAFASANHEDQYTASFARFANSNNKIGNLAPITLSSTNTYSTYTQINQKLSENNAEGVRMLFVSPAIKRQMKLDNILGSTDTGLGMRLRGLIGEFDGLQVMETNNLPHVKTLTVDTQITATDTMLIDGLVANTTSRVGFDTNTVTFTFKANAGATNPGDISIGADLAAAKQNIIDAINGTGTPGASTYIEMSTANRNSFKNAFISASTAFVSDVINVQSSRTTAMTETFTAGTNIFGVDAVLSFAVDNQAINTVFQEDVFKITDAELGFRKNILQEKVYGGKVFDENAKGLATVEIVA